MSEEKKKSQSGTAVKNFLSGGVGGMCLVVSGHPFDLIKVRIQAAKPGEYAGITDVVKKTIAKDGMSGLYRGMLPPLIGVTPIFAVVFWGYDMGQKLARMPFGQSASEKLSFGQIVFAGGFSAVPATLMMAPAERIKVLLQVQQGEKKSAGTVIRELYREGGVRSIWRGTGATLVRDGPGSMAYFGVYEILRNVLSQGGDPNSLNPVATLVAGGFAGMANWMVAIPADVIKSRLQTAPTGTYNGFMDCVRKTVEAEGSGALFKGLRPALLRAFPANAACFFGVEVTRQFLNTLW